jgi:outer membrane autotransporter protein
MQSAVHAGVTANDATYTFPLVFTEGEMVTLTLNVTEQADASGSALVSGSPRPAQLFSATSTDASVVVSKFRNCINVSFVTPGPSSFSVMYNMADGTNPGPPNIDTGIITFVASSTQSYAPQESSSCGDGEGIPSAQDDLIQILAGKPVLIPVVDNDFPQSHVIFAPGSGDNDVFQITTQNGGTAIALPDNRIQYTPAAGFVGTDTFSYILEAYSQPGFEALNPVATVSVMVAADPTEPTIPPQGPGLTNAQLLVNGGTITTIADSDLKPGETVLFAVVETVPEELADIVNYDWFVGGEPVPRQSGASAQFTVALPDGVNEITVVAKDDRAMTASLSATVTIATGAAPGPNPEPIPNPPPAPTPHVPDGQILVNGGTATSLADSDLKPGETVLFAAATKDSEPPIDVVNFDWFVGQETEPRQSGASPKFTVALPDGASVIRVVGKGELGMIGSLSITVTIAAAPAMLSELSGLPPNQMGVAGALDRMCRDTPTTDPSSMSEDQQDALARCQAIARSAPADQMRALEELSGMDLNGSRTQTLLFTKSTYSGVSDRLGALRGGARGVSLRGLNLIIDGKAIPLAEVERMVGKLLGGGASADEVGSLLGDKWGFWTRGNMTIGSKSASDADRGFKANQFSVVSGLDYRISNDSVIGGAVSFGSSNVAYNPIGEGGLDTKSWALTLYGTTYALKRGYLDVSLNVADSTYASHRRINYTDSLGLVDRDARGSTGGLTLSSSLAGGYDLVFGGLSISPNGSLFFTDSGIDGFRERGAGGLDLAYEDQNFESLTATLGMRITYALRLPFGVLMPYFRGDFVRELESKVAVFNVRFANDLDTDAAPITVQADTPDRSYWRLSAGLSAQLPFGFAGYVEYQRLESFQFVDFQDLALGLRMQYRF